MSTQDPNAAVNDNAILQPGTGGQLEINVLENDDFDAANSTFNPLPYTGFGEMTVSESGDVVFAIVASSAFPGLFPPVELAGHTLIDGGVVADMPLDVAADLGMASVVVITVPPLAPTPVPRHAVAVALRTKPVTVCSTF